MIEDSQDLCCSVGIETMSDNLILGACSVVEELPDQLEFSEFGECIQRSFTQTTYKNPADDSEVEGYPSRTDLILSEKVHNNICCLQGCDISLDASAQLLKACHSFQMSDSGITYKDPSIGEAMTDAEGNVTPGFCEVVEVSGIVYSLGEDTEGGVSEGEEACTLNSEITRSTEFPEDGVTNLHCCKAAVDAGESISNDLYCQVTYEFSDPFNVEYDAENEKCQQTEGTSTKQYRDQAYVVQGTEEPKVVETDPIDVDDSACCAAYDETDPNADIELTFACPENDEMETTFEIREGVCY